MFVLRGPCEMRRNGHSVAGQSAFCLPTCGEEACWRAFKTFDQDGSGHIDKEDQNQKISEVTMGPMGRKAVHTFNNRGADEAAWG